jgi:transcriptional regulator with XRE-family HTH domain
MPSSPYNSFLPDWRERLRRVLEERRYSARAVSIDAGLGQTTVSEWLNPNKRKQPSLESFAAVAKLLNISLDNFVDASLSDATVGEDRISPATIEHAQLLGELRAGNWRERDVYSVDETTLVPAFNHPDFAGIKQYAWRVSGNSMNRLARHNSFVIGVSFHDISRFRRLRTDDLVVCQRRNGDLHEYTLKRAVLENGVFRLEPESHDERHQKPIWLASDPHGEDEDVQATHLIIGGFQFFI